MLKAVQSRLRRKLGMVMICSITLVVLGVQLVHACWAAISLEDFIKGNQVIVVGEIQRVTSAPESYYSEDTAFIKVDKILRRWLPSPELTIGTEIPLSMPAVSNQAQMSTDIFYSKGQRGVWILYFQKGKHHAGHPMSLQPLAEEAKITAIVNEQAKQRAALSKLSVKK